MRKIFFIIKPVLLVFSVFAFITGFAQVTTPRVPSPAGMVQQTIGISTVTIKYSRPSVRGREVWGKLVPYGWNVQAFGAGNSAPWRAGANENTVISFSDDAMIEGHKVPAGDYGLFFTINPDNTGEVILSKDYKSWGSFFYDSTNDVMRAKINLRDIPQTEMLTYNFINDTKNSAELVLNWEKKQFPVKIEFDVDKIVIDNASAQLKGATGFNAVGFASAAMYAQQNNVDLDKGLKWINQAIVMDKKFAYINIKSNIMQQMGKGNEATSMMDSALNTATEVEINQYGYQLLNAGQTDKAIEVLTLNTKRFPKSANTWDSLGEAYTTKGDKKNAIACFKKSLSMNPPANVRANSEKFMHQLGAM